MGMMPGKISAAVETVTLFCLALKTNASSDTLGATARLCRLAGHVFG